MGPNTSAFCSCSGAIGNWSAVSSKEDMQHEQFLIETESLLLAVKELSRKLLRSFKISLISLSRTEIWSFEDDDAVNMKIAEPTLTAYECYPELFVVPSDFCSNTRTGCHQNKSARAFSKKTRKTRKKTFIVKSFIQSSKLNFCE